MSKALVLGAVLCVALVAIAGAAAVFSDDEDTTVVTTDEAGSSSSGSTSTGTGGTSGTSADGTDGTADDQDSADSSSSASTDDSDEGSVYTIGSLTITYVEGSARHTATAVDGETVITFSDATSDIEVSLSGTLEGSIVIDIDESYELKLVLNGVVITSYDNAPIDAESADKVTISAKSGTENYIYDYRDEVTDEDAISSAVYATMDLDVQGKGYLSVISTNNNGIHSKDDLSIKNLTLYVSCQDNALKGNDSVTIESGSIELVSYSGDGIKTTNCELKTKSDGTTKQLGNVYIDTDEGDTTVTVWAALDGIDAAYGVYISGSPTVTIYTGSYSGTTSSTTGSDDTLGAGFGPGGSTPGVPGSGTDPFGPGGGNGDWQNGDGSDYSDTNTESRKGIKGDYLVEISGGTIVIQSSDDSIHSNGYVTVSGGTIELTSGDDGIHADGALTITGGTIDVAASYEGIEGDTIAMSGGSVSVISTDDGFNSTGTSGTGISISGGYVYVYSGGDSLDSNSYTSYQGVVISGGRIVLISNGASDTAIDTESGYTYTGGYLIGISQGGGMSSENTYTQSGSVTSTTLSASSGRYLTVTVGGSVVVSVLMPTSISNASAVYLGSGSASITTSSSASGTCDSNGVLWKV